MREDTGLPVATELMDARDLEAVYDHVDLIWIGARNMQNFNLLSEIGKIDKPVMLKRGMSATVEELLMAAEYVAKEGNERIILCERGIRTFERSTRFTLDIGAIPVLKAETHLPVIVDPSHAAGKRQLVAPLALAAVAAGADGLIVETHPNPEHALSDAAQQIPSAQFASFVRRGRVVPRGGWQDPLAVDRVSLRLAVVGLGLMGGSLGLAARERAGAEVAGYDPDPAARAAAVERGCVTTVHGDAAPRPSRAPTSSCVCAPDRRAARGDRRGARRGARRHGHRHRVDQERGRRVRRRRQDRAPLRRRPSDLRPRGARRAARGRSTCSSARPGS